MTTGDSGLERLLGRVLNAGSLASTALLAAGLGVGLFAPGVRLERSALTMGLIVLMATPIMRVLVSVIDYTQRRDWLFVGLTLTVLIELAASVVVAFTT